MFKKLSSALVAISLVAVAQPALAQDVTVEMGIFSKTDNSVMSKNYRTGWPGMTWTFLPGSIVTVDGKKADKTQVTIGMVCKITGTRTGYFDNNVKPNGNINTMDCKEIRPGA